MSLEEKCNLAESLIKREDERPKGYDDILLKLNASSDKVNYSLKKCKFDNYWYIIPVFSESEEVSFSNKNLETKSNTFKDVIFSDKQFSNDHYAWELNPESDFILDMIPKAASPKYVAGRFSYNPIEKEFLFDGLRSSHSATIDRFGNFEFNEYQRGIYLEDKRLILFRPYFNPKNEKGEFDAYKGIDYEQNNIMTDITINMLQKNNMPKDMKIITNINNNTLRRYVSFYI